MPRKIRDARECPRDWTPLSKEIRHTHLRAVEADTCPKCKGIFLDKKEIRKLTGDWSLNKLLTKYAGLESDSQLV